MMPVKLFELEPIQYPFTIRLPCISIKICSIMCACVRPKSQSLALRSKSMMTCRSVFYKWIPACCKQLWTAMNHDHLLPCLLAFHLSSIILHALQVTMDKGRRLAVKETHLGLDQSEVKQEAIVIGIYWLSGNFALLGCNWSNKQFNGQCEPCRGLDKNGLTHQADMLWLLGLPRIKTNTSHAQPFKILLLTQLHLLHCSAKSPLQRPDKAVTGAKTSRDVAVGPCLNST